MIQMCVSEQNNQRLLKHILLFALPLSLVLLLISGCANSLNQQNYLACKLKLEADRKKARAGQAYSYKSQSFEECRAPSSLPYCRRLNCEIFFLERQSICVFFKLLLELAVINKLHQARKITF